MIFLQDFFGILWDFHEVSLEFLWWFYDISTGLLLDSHGVSMVFL